MNVSYFVKKWLNKMLKKKGQSGLIAYLSSFLGSSLANTVVRTLVSKGASAAIRALGGKIGALAGPAGIAIGWISGAL